MKILNRIEIQAIPEKVFYWLEDPDHAMEWMTSVTKSQIINETSNRVGTTFREHIEENGREIELDGVITEFVQNKLFAVHLEGEFNSVEVRFSLDEKNGMTQLTQNVELHFKGMMRILSIFLNSSLKKKIISQAQSEFAKLKVLCEQEI